MYMLCLLKATFILWELIYPTLMIQWLIMNIIRIIPWWSRGLILIFTSKMLIAFRLSPEHISGWTPKPLPLLGFDTLEETEPSWTDATAPTSWECCSSLQICPLTELETLSGKAVLLLVPLVCCLLLYLPLEAPREVSLFQMPIPLALWEAILTSRGEFWTIYSVNSFEKKLLFLFYSILFNNKTEISCTWNPKNDM